MRAARALLLAVCGSVLLLLAWLLFVWPPPSWYRSHWPRTTAFMQLRESQLRAAGDPEPRRYAPVELDDMSSWLPKAATAAEDEAFYIHHGIDWHALGQVLGYRRSGLTLSDARDRDELKRALGNAWSKRERLRGASTITQQLAKNLYLSPSRNPLRKLKEALIAYRLEWALPKERILALYLNVAELGPNLWGVEAASQAYFGKPAERLSIEEAASLMATLPHPLTSNPAHRPSRTEARAQLILRHLRGEPVEVPLEEPSDTVPPVPPIRIPLDSTLARDTVTRRTDSLSPVPVAIPDSTKRVPADTTRPKVPDTLRARPRDTTRTRPPDTTKPRVSPPA